MIAYKEEWLNNLQVRNEASLANDKLCISAQEKEQVFAAYPVGFYTPNPFVRIGLFILTCVILTFSMGLVSLLFLNSFNSDDFIGGIFIFFGFLIYGGLELMVSKRHYKSGVDDALMWAAAGCIITGLNTAINTPAQINALLVFVLALLLFLRFHNAIMAAIAGLALLAFVFLSLVKLGEMAKAIAPFVIMMASALLYFFVKQNITSGKWKLYTNGWLWLSVTALVAFYAAGNYFIVREASVAMFNLELKEGENIPFGWLFWIFTVAIPVVYIVRGLQKKDAVLLRVGLLLVAAIVFTVRYYFHVMPAEIAMVLGGIVFIVLAYAVMKYLETPKQGFTSKDQNETFFMDKLQVESLVIAETFTGPALPETDAGVQFGGGSGGGGGASGEF